MLNLIKNKISKIRRNLSSLDNQPIGKAALTILIFLDLFILISIFDGLDDHTRQLTSPSELVPQYCRDIVIEGDWNKTNRLALLAKTVSDSRGRYYWPDDRERTQERHASCQPIATLFLSIEDDDGLSDNLKEFLKTQSEIRRLNSELERVKSAYDTSLLEKIADQEKGQANVDSLKQAIAKKTASVNALVKKKKLLNSSINQDKRIRDLFSVIENLTQDDRNKLRDDLRDLNFWYPVKRLAMEMIFLLPLFLVFYFWNMRSISLSRQYQTLVSSHLLVVVFVPAFFKIVELIYDIIPKKFLKQLIDLLESLNLVAIWHYLMMAVTILIALSLFYLFQKKIFSREKLIEKRISNGACQNCGKHLPLQTVACPFCGFEQYKQCGNCNNPTYIYGKFCKECGHGDS